MMKKKREGFGREGEPLYLVEPLVRQLSEGKFGVVKLGCLACLLDGIVWREQPVGLGFGRDGAFSEIVFRL